MTTPAILTHDDFQLAFRTSYEASPSSENILLQDFLGPDGCVIQEKIIVPPALAARAAEFSLYSHDPSRCCKPLILIGHPDLPVQHSCIIARPRHARTKIERRGPAIVMTADGTCLVFSDPLFSEQDASVRSFSSAFEGVSRTLQKCGMTKNALVRTWLFLENILRDYDALNTARKNFFASWHTPDTPFIPASTGIEGRIVDLKPLSIQFCAFSGDRLTVRQQPSPLQNEATAYGKLFSRCAVVEFPRSRLAYISGTAAIDKNGGSLYPGDLEKQLTFTLEVLSALLRELKGDYARTAQATVYLKRHEDLDVSLSVLRKAGFPTDRCLFLTDATVCRDELLCEIELTAVMDIAL